MAQISLISIFLDILAKFYPPEFILALINDGQYWYSSLRTSMKSTDKWSDKNFKTKGEMLLLSSGFPEIF